MVVLGWSFLAKIEGDPLNTQCEEEEEEEEEAVFISVVNTNEEEEVVFTRDNLECQLPDLDIGTRLVSVQMTCGIYRM